MKHGFSPFRVGTVGVFHVKHGGLLSLRGLRGGLCEIARGTMIFGVLWVFGCRDARFNESATHFFCFLGGYEAEGGEEGATATLTVCFVDR